MIKYVLKKRISVPEANFSSSAKIRVLAAGDCPAFFPADVIQSGNSIHLCYSTGNYQSLRRWSNLTSEQVFGAVRAVLIHVEAARDWMWFPEEYVISSDTVWMDITGRVRILCIPENKEVSYSHRMQCFLHDLKRLSEPAVSSCIELLQEQIAAGNLQTERLLSEIDLMMAELQSYS